MGPDAIAITGGGDFLSFARVGLSAPSMLDPGPFGCIGVGVPYGIAASLAFPDRPVVVTGDGAFGFNAIEIDTAVRHKAPVLFVVANNGAWQIEVHDQTVTYGKVVGTRLQFSDHAAMARAFGMHTERVETQEQLGPAIARTLARRPALLDVVVMPEAVSSDAKTGLTWVPDLQPLAAWDDAERRWRGGI
jgi:acetolactate synthase I/II/III large subunit